ncbi:MAG: SURF1 family protein [Nitriliruptoraceae bacterium]
MTRQLFTVSAILRHLLVLSVVAALVTLGQWQLSRLHEIRAINALAAERMAAPPVDLDTLLASLPSPEAGAIPWTHDKLGHLEMAELEHRRVQLTGRFIANDEVLQRNREHRGRSGFHLLTPFFLSQPDASGQANEQPTFNDARVVLVRRGWIPPQMSEPPISSAAPPAGEVTITGILELPVTQPSFGPQDPDEGQLARVFHTDTSRLDRQIEGDLFAMVVRLEQPDGTASPSEPSAPESVPAAIGAPILDEANHLSYAVQWHAFAALALVTYAAWIFTQHRPTASRKRHQAAPHR